TVGGGVEGVVWTGVVEGVGGGRQRFVHALTREAVYEAIPIAERKLLHAAVAAVLSGEGEEANLPAIAYHLAQAEDWDAAATALRQAGEQAGRLAAGDDAPRRDEGARRAPRGAPAAGR